MMTVQQQVQHVQERYGRYICQECDGCGARVLSTVEWMVREDLNKCPRCGHPDAVAWEPSVLEMVLNNPLWKAEYNEALELVEYDGAAVIFREEIFRVRDNDQKTSTKGDNDN